MRSNLNFIEITGKSNGKTILINKTHIAFITKDDDECAVIAISDGHSIAKIPTKESYKDVAREIFWFGWRSEHDDYLYDKGLFSRDDNYDEIGEE